MFQSIMFSIHLDFPGIYKALSRNLLLVSLNSSVLSEVVCWDLYLFCTAGMGFAHWRRGSILIHFVEGLDGIVFLDGLCALRLCVFKDVVVT